MRIPESKRLKFKLLVPPEDADLLMELDGDPKVMRFISGGKPSVLNDILTISMPRIVQYRNVDRGWGIWMVYLKTNDEFLGWILVRPMGFFSEAPDESDLELGRRFKSSSWGNGYATESASAVMNALIENGERKFTAMAIPENDASIGVMKKLGMMFLKQDTHHDPVGGSDEVVYYQKIVGDDVNE